ncbi:NADPH-dependent F420 reductase [Hyalangium sp.]|uniref:NADPH-dependent F420 reductase n=1 Tax=Hyalangium sp. TaxID=2028555 RepID=UPI002D63A91A|nr:NAD(P)-binding domain-containing protein [Hyalangium sp.]HYI02466.1 NAD(P)-binding domain-containing protein [Hyalangium sp.]
MSQNPRIAIVGAGNVGGNLGIRFARSGYSLRFGVREGSNADDVIAKCEGKAEAASIPEAAKWADVIFLSVPGNAAVEATRSMGDISGKVLVDCNNPLKWEDGPVHTPPPEGSITAALAKAFPTARLVKGFNTFGAEFHLDPTLGNTSIDVQLAGESAEAKALVSSIATRAGFNPIDVGLLRNAAHLESLAILWIHLALRAGHGRQIGFKLLKRE